MEQLLLCISNLFFVFSLMFNVLKSFLKKKLPFIIHMDVERREEKTSICSMFLTGWWHKIKPLLIKASFPLLSDSGEKGGLVPEAHDGQTRGLRRPVRHLSWHVHRNQRDWNTNGTFNPRRKYSKWGRGLNGFRFYKLPAGFCHQADLPSARHPVEREGAPSGRPQWAQRPSWSFHGDKWGWQENHFIAHQLHAKGGGC